MANETENKVNFRTINLSAEAKKAWGEKWNQPEVSYRFSNGREFKLKTEDASIYSSSPDF